MLTLVELDEVQVSQRVDDVVRREFGDLADVFHTDGTRMRLQHLHRRSPVNGAALGLNFHDLRRDAAERHRMARKPRACSLQSQIPTDGL